MSFTLRIMTMTYKNPTNRAFFTRARFLLSMRCLLLGYSFEPRPNSHALGTEGSVMTIGLLCKPTIALENREQD